MGVTTRTNSSENRHCRGKAHGLFSAIAVGERYERVARIPGPTIESYHEACFVDTFGERGLYGE